MNKLEFTWDSQKAEETISGVPMRENYDFSKSVKNPYSKQLKEQVTIDLEKDIIQYFEEIAQETGISYLNLINLYLRECMENKRKLSLIESNN
ncbi:antitoxin [Aphanizomenon sp. CS-733/32]|nr:antitoxin [Aphanizomenon sp. CS-733/32]MDB9308798.1 antitoxin [Aphanizomenon sp. CS-733/32]